MSRYFIFTISILLAFNVSHAYYEGHINITKAAIQCLVLNGYGPFANDLLNKTINDKTYLSYIIDGIDNNSGVLGPDNKAYYDPAFEAAIDQIILDVYNGMPSPVQVMFTFADFKAKMRSFAPAGMSNAEEILKSSIQHTYCLDIQGDNLLDKISKAPYYAQLEFDKAVQIMSAANKAKDQSQQAAGLAQLGRSIHYIQDLTVPHHTNLMQNTNDATTAAFNGGNTQLASQFQYEVVHINTYFQVNEGNNAENWSALFHGNQFPIEKLCINLIDMTKSITQISIDNAKTARPFFDYCDGMCEYAAAPMGNGGFDLLSASPCTMNMDAWDGSIYSIFLGAYYVKYVFNKKTQLCGCPWGICGCADLAYPYYGKYENFDYVASSMLPIAIKSTTLAIIKFFNTAPPTIADPFSKFSKIVAYASSIKKSK